MKTVRLKKGREASLQRRHPWVFSGAIETVEGSPQAGDVVRVVGSDRTLLGVGAWSPESQIRVRLLRFEDGAIDRDFLQVTLAAALAKRDSYLRDGENNACRLVFGESDHLPGLIVDRYDDFLVCQFQFAGLEPWKTTLVELLAE